MVRVRFRFRFRFRVRVRVRVRARFIVLARVRVIPYPNPNHNQSEESHSNQSEASIPDISYKKKKQEAITNKDCWTPQISMEEPVRGPLTFGPLQQVNLQDGLGRGLAPPHQEPHHGARLLQGLHRPAVHHLRHVHLVDPQHAVVHPEGGGGRGGVHYAHSHTSDLLYIHIYMYI